MPPLLSWLTPLALLLVVAVSAGSTAVVIRVVIRLGFVAVPRADRWHTRVTALHGGVGFAPIFLLLSAAIVVFAAVQLHAGSIDAFRATGLLEPAAVLLGGAAMFILGLVDDFLGLKPSTKLAGQIAAAAPLLVAVGPFELTSWLPLDLLITYLWIIGITNAVNLLDNMDGVSAGVCAVSFAAISATLSVHGGEGLPAAAWMSAILSAATVGFWIHNRPPAKVFMGDSQPLSSLQQGLVAIAFAGTPILDTVLVTVTRLWRNQSPAVGGKDHSTHRLARLGLDGWQTLAIVLALAAASGLAGFSMVSSPSTIYPLFGLYLVGLLLVGVWLSRVPVAVSQASGAVQDFIRRRQTRLVQVAKAAVDVLVVATCYYGAYLLRFDFSIDDPTRAAVVQSLPIVLACCLVAHLAFRSYTRSWRSGAATEMVDHALPAIVGAAASVAVVVVAFGLPLGYSRGAFVIFGVLLVIATLLSRFSFVMLDELSARLRARTSEARSVVIYGAGRAGRLLASEAPFVPGGPVRVVGFIDDDASKHGFRIAGIRVSGPEWWSHPRRHRPTEIWISSPLVPKARIERLRALIGADLPVRWLDVRISGLSADSDHESPTQPASAQAS
jgi:UDP-GlcNAc:undecaprenyl-phosphate GlcNAc-1-phosphate transferase